MATAFGGALAFLTRLGVFETVLPFLLVFTLVFAFLEKTKVFGVEKYRSDVDNVVYDVPKKNLNSMAAFCIAFFVVASAQLVALVSEVTSKVVLLIILVFCFTLTIGAFQKEQKEGFALNKTWTVVFEIIVFVGIALIFLNALGWLDDIFNWLNGVWGSEATASLVMVLLLIGLMVFITRDKKPGNSKDAEKSK
jgi:hypothetical protein